MSLAQPEPGEYGYVPGVPLPKQPWERFGPRHLHRVPELLLGDAIDGERADRAAMAYENAALDAQDR